MKTVISEAEDYKAVLERIVDETTMMEQMSFGSAELESKLMSAHNLKMYLYAANVLERYKPKAFQADLNGNQGTD